MLIAAIDPLIHHSIIFEMNVESYRRRAAVLVMPLTSLAGTIERPAETPRTAITAAGNRASLPAKVEQEQSVSGRQE
jgi:hypothetical protein